MGEKNPGRIWGRALKKKHKNILQIGVLPPHIVPHSFRPKIPEGGVDFIPLEIRPIISSGGGYNMGGWFGLVGFAGLGFLQIQGKNEGGNMDPNFERIFPGLRRFICHPAPLGAHSWIQHHS